MVDAPSRDPFPQLLALSRSYDLERERSSGFLVVVGISPRGNPVLLVDPERLRPLLQGNQTMSKIPRYILYFLQVTVLPVNVP